MEKNNDLVDGKKVWETLESLASVPDPWWAVDWRPVHFLALLAMSFKKNPKIPVSPPHPRPGPSLSLLSLISL